MAQVLIQKQESDFDVESILLPLVRETLESLQAEDAQEITASEIDMALNHETPERYFSRPWTENSVSQKEIWDCIRILSKEGLVYPHCKSWFIKPRFSPEQLRIIKASARLPDI